LKEESKPRVFENRVLRRIFGPKKDKVTGQQRRLHNMELYALYSSPNNIQVIKSRRFEVVRACSMNGGKQMCIQGFSEETCGKDTTRKTQA
jgi:hypothetical protein